MEACLLVTGASKIQQLPVLYGSNPKKYMFLKNEYN